MKLKTSSKTLSTLSSFLVIFGSLSYQTHAQNLAQPSKEGILPKPPLANIKRPPPQFKGDTQKIAKALQNYSENKKPQNPSSIKEDNLSNLAYSQTREEYKTLLTSCLQTHKEDTLTCSLYQTGIFNGLIAGYITSKGQLPFCLKKSPNNTEFDKDLLETLNDPNSKTKIIANIILETLVKKYPCPPSQNSEKTPNNKN